MPPLPTDPIAEARQNWRDHGWTDTAEAMAAVTSVMRVHQIMLARVDTVLRAYGMTFARFELLRLLAFTHEGHLPMTRLRDLLQIHPASVTSIVDRLELDGLVRRASHPDDGRAVLVELTDAGRTTVEGATLALNEQVFATLELDATEVTSLTRLLADFRQRAGDFAEPRPIPDPL